MTNLTRWEPFREMRRLHTMMDRIMDDSFGRTLLSDYEGNAAVDIYQTDENVFVEAVMPGIKPENIDISIRGDVLSIQGKASEEYQEEGGQEVKYLVRERRRETLSRTLRLPTLVNADKATADFKDGILKLTLPKVEAVKPKQITIKAK